MTQTFSKDPDARLDYSIVWYNWLDGDTLSSHTIVADSGITIVSSAINSVPVTIKGQTYPAHTVVTIWLSGGTVGAGYDLVNHIKTVGGREEDKTIRIEIRQH